jgi:hypothetical protein
LKITPSREIVEKEEHADELARSPEPELLKYQRSKTMPKIALIEVNEESEELILEIDNIEQLQDQDKLEYGMLPAGSDEIIMGTLQREGIIAAQPVEAAVEFNLEERKEAIKDAAPAIESSKPADPKPAEPQPSTVDTAEETKDEPKPEVKLPPIAIPTSPKAEEGRFLLCNT